MTNKEQESIKSAAFIFTRLAEHEQAHGRPVRNDPELWREVDFNSASPELSRYFIENLREFARFNTHWQADIEQWCDEVLARQPAYLRQRGDKWTSNDNNTMIWRLMMLFREVVQQELDLLELNTFSEHFELQDR